MTRSAYAEAGVDVDAGETAVSLMRSRTRGANWAGEFASLMEIPAGMQRPLIVSATDGVGTKTEIARRLGRYDTIGRDLVAMCADDVVCHGAAPTYFLDYVAVGRLDPQRVAEIVGGIGAACEEIGCSLVGGETAEHPGAMDADTFDLAGFCVGFVDSERVIEASASRDGDVIVGVASSGLHSNGYSLVRRLLESSRLTLTDDLLTPTALYAPAVLEMARSLRDSGLRVGGLAHVTGGGLARNLPRALPAALGARVRPDGWRQLEIFDRIALAAGISGAEMRATFNCGIGFAAVVEPAAADRAVAVFHDRGFEAWVIGDVQPIDAAGGQRYVEA